MRKALVYTADPAAQALLLQLCADCGAEPNGALLHGGDGSVTVPTAAESSAELAVVYGRAYCPFPKYCLPVLRLRLCPEEILETVLAAAAPGERTAVVISAELLREKPTAPQDGGVIWIAEEDYDSLSAAAAAAAEQAELLAGTALLEPFAVQTGRRFLHLLPGQISYEASLRLARETVEQMERQLALRSRLNAYMNSASGGFIEVDRDGRIVLISENAQYQLGCRGSFVNGRYVLNVFPQLDKQMLDAALVFGYSINGHPTGKRGSFVVSIEPIHDADGGTDGAVIWFRSVRTGTGAEPRSVGSEGLRALHRFETLAYRSRSFAYLINRSKLLSYTDSPVLIVGEEGTERCELAQCIHNESRRERMNYLELECGALDEGRLRAMLFGTGTGDAALCGTELCRGGTIFFDHIERLSPELQYEVYRLITGWYVPTDAAQPRSADVRVIAATDRKLRELVLEGSFREDLYYAVSAATLNVPPIRERREDVEDILRHYVAVYCEEYGKRVTFSEGARACLRGRDWPGNLREIENFCRRLVLNTPYKSISESFVAKTLAELENAPVQEPPVPEKPTADPEALRILEALRRCEGNRIETARALGISKATLWRKMQKYGITSHYTL